MVQIDEVNECVDSDPSVQPDPTLSPPTLPSQERLLDALEIENVMNQLSRPTARMQLESLAIKLRKESSALERVEKSQGRTVTSNIPVTDQPVVPPMIVTAPPPTLLSTPTGADSTATIASHSSPSVLYKAIDRYSFDAGGYNAPFVTVYVPLPGVGVSIPRENVACHFTKDTFDLTVRDLQGSSYRLYRDCLEKDIDPSKSKIVVKADKVIVKLAKVSTSYGGFDYWTKLMDPKKQKISSASGNGSSTNNTDDPQASIMNLMKEMYESGDDTMKKMIGETMMKQQRGELGKGRDPMDMDGMDDL